MFDPYYEEDLPFRGNNVKPVVNSEHQFNCWFIENPTKKVLEKTTIIVMPPKASQELIIVVKAPMKPSFNLLSFIEIVHLPEEQQKTSRVEKRIGEDG